MQISYLVTTEQMLNYMTGEGVNTSGANFTKNAVLYRLSAYKKICNHLGYDILTADYVDEYYDGSGMRKMYLRNRPVTALTEVKLEDSVTTEYTLIENYLFAADGFITPGINNIKVSYTAGWNQSTMPGDIRHAALKLISLYSGELGGAGTTIGKASISDGAGGSESIDIDAEQRILDSLNQYRNNAKL